MGLLIVEKQFLGKRSTEITTKQEMKQLETYNYREGKLSTVYLMAAAK